MTTEYEESRMNTSANNAWMVDYVHALLAMQQEVEGDRPESDGVDADHAMKLAQARTELLQRQQRAKAEERRSQERR
ncbi:MAG: hypothetical protein ABI599_13235 [Flavobacteriales bacterium]